MKNVIKGLSATKRAEIKDIIEVSAEAVYLLGFTDGQASTVEDAATVAQPNYQTENRIAKIGETILITNPISTCGQYKNGDVKEVIEVRSSAVSTKGVEVGIFHSEYEVIVSNEAVEPELLTTNQQRAETNQRAREFVEKFQAVRDGDETHVVGNTTALEHWYETDFFVKERKVTAVVYHLVFGKKRVKRSSHVGRAFCAPGDVFNELIGKAIALAKALQIAIPQEFIDAVQPDDFATGQVTEHVDGELLTITGLSEREAWTGSTWWYRNIEDNPELKGIIDDTNAEYEVG